MKNPAIATLLWQLLFAIGLFVWFNASISIAVYLTALVAVIIITSSKVTRDTLDAVRLQSLRLSLGANVALWVLLISLNFVVWLFLVSQLPYWEITFVRTYPLRLFLTGSALLTLPFQFIGLSRLLRPL